MVSSVHASELYTGRDLLRDRYLVFEGTTLRGVSRERRGELIGEFPVITPALIDAHCHIGMQRSGEPGSEGEANDQMDSLLFLADALDSVQMDDPAFGESVEMGVLYFCVLPGSGNIVGGRAAVIRNWASTTSDALVTRAGIKAAFGHNPRSVRDWKGTRPWTRMGAISLLRKRLDEVRQKTTGAKSRKGGKADLTAEERLIADLLRGREILRAHVHKEDDIAALLRLREEFGLRVSVEHAGDVHTSAIYRPLRELDIPVVYGPLDAFAYKVELRHENWRNIRHLVESGVRYGLMTDHPVIPQRNLLLGLRWFIRCGLDRRAAIEVVTRRNAELLGIADRLGTLERGKLASFVCWSGDPFDVTSWPLLVVGEGTPLFDDRPVAPPGSGRAHRRPR